MGKMPKVPSTIALESGKQSSFTKRVSKLKKRVQEESKDGSPSPVKQLSDARRGLVYLSHIPHGFYEQQILSYFKQFGKVTNVRVLRSHNTGKSKGAAFVEFKEPEVAKIAAETMDNYLMFKRRIEAKFIEPENKHKTLFKFSVSARKFPKQKRVSATREAKNTNIDDAEHQRKIALKLKKLNKTGMLNCLQISGLDFGLKSKDLQNLQENKENNTNIKPLRKKKSIKPNKGSKVELKLEFPVDVKIAPHVPTEKKKKKVLKSKKINEETDESSEDPELELAPEVKIASRKSLKNKTNGTKNYVKKSLKTIQKTRTVKKDKAVLNANVIEKITTRTKSGKKGQLALDSNLIQHVDLPARMMKSKVRRLGKK